MLSRRETSAEPAILPAPPPISSDDSLFLDFDGTLVELADTPDAVIVGADLLALLERLSIQRQGRVAIVTGRAIAQIDALLGPAAATIAIAGSHGAEWRLPGGTHRLPETTPALAEAAQVIEAFVAAHPGLVFERKSFGLGLHYRLAPEHEAAAVALATRIAAEHGLVAQGGKMMAEVRMPGDKGAAVRALLAVAPFAGTTPWFCGDDLTDEAGFLAASELGGAGILVGEPRTTAAIYGLESVAAMRGWLAAATGVRA